MNKLLYLFIVIAFLFPATAHSQVTLLTPADGAQLSSAPTFSWSGSASYDAYYIQTYFYYEVGQFAGNYLLGTWVPGTSIAMPSTLWDKVGTGQPCYWRVLGYDADSSQGAWSGIWSFEKSACPGPTGTIYDVDNVNDMLSALASAGSGDMVRLAQGTYYPPVQIWSSPPDYSDIHANLVVKNGVILSGSGKDSTTIYISGTLGSLFTYGNATLRDLTVRPQGENSWWLIYGSGKGTFGLTLCNVAVNGGGYMTYGYGVFLQPWGVGNASLQIIDSSVTCSGCPLVWGIYADACGTESPTSIDVDVQNTIVSGWENGLYYESGVWACGGTVSVNADCAGFSDNTHNVYECTDHGFIEHCP